MKRVYKRKSESMPAAESEKKYEATAFEADAIAKLREAQKTSGPSLKITSTGVNSVAIKVDHPDETIGHIALMKAIGTPSYEFMDGLLGHLVNASKADAPSEGGANFMLAVIKGIEPRDQIEAMLAAQMAAVHMASMTFARRLAQVENIPQQDSAANAFNKLTRTYAAQVAALKEYRSKGEQKMTVQHVHVAEGGQAIVGNVNATQPGGGARGKSGERPHALGYAPGETLPCDLETERKAMPSASGAGV